MENSHRKTECTKVQWLSSEYLHNELSKEKRLLVENHLKTCSLCNIELEKLKKTIDAIDKTYEPEPPAYLKAQFAEFINKEQAKQQLGRTKTPVNYTNRILVRVAAAIALLLVGNAIGLFTYPYLIEHSSKQEVAMIKHEVSALKEALVISMINQESASERVRAVDMTNELKELDHKLFTVLLETLNYDPSPNVRLTAAQALSRYMDSEQVRDSLVNSLQAQTNPLVQISLINIIVTSNAPQAAESLMQFAKSKDLMHEVKQLLDIQIKQLEI